MVVPLYFTVEVGDTTNYYVKDIYFDTFFTVLLPLCFLTFSLISTAQLPGPVHGRWFQFFNKPESICISSTVTDCVNHEVEFPVFAQAGFFAPSRLISEVNSDPSGLGPGHQTLFYLANR
jgi:hypothetical protein